ncbi:MAG: leucyl aminopeptidase [Frankiaceae bacterium]
MVSAAFSAEPAAELPVDVLAIGAAEGEDGVELLPGADSVAAAFDGRLPELLADFGVRGGVDEVTRLPAPEAVRARQILVVGVGKRERAQDPQALRHAAGVAVRAMSGRERGGFALPADEPGAAAAVAEGALLGAYSFDLYRSESPSRKAPVGSVVIARRAGSADEVLARAEILCRSVALARDLVNTPPADLAPTDFAERAAEEATLLGLACQVWGETALRDAGFGGILGVGQGSTRPPRLVRIAWPGSGGGPSVALVGKGITFDSGGLSLKPPQSMEWMKTDMAGAAAVLGAVLAAARLALPVAVTGWLPLAENMPSGSATRPSDVLTMYGGMRVEVLNTDAEGRLVLGDALARAAEDSPDALIDVATLTGAQIVALGNRTAGVMGNDEALRERVAAAARESGEPVWAMPLPPELRKGLDSAIADIANVPGGGGRDGGMLTAAHFLAEFVPPGRPWAHLDIAGPAWNGGEPYGYTPKGGTGFAVRTLVRTLELTAAG